MAYAEKFRGLIAAIKTARDEKAGVILVPSPQTLGDDYTELLESLNRISAAGLSLQILPLNERRRPDYSRN